MGWVYKAIPSQSPSLIDNNQDYQLSTIKPAVPTLHPYQLARRQPSQQPASQMTSNQPANSQPDFQLPSGLLAICLFLLQH